MVKCPMCHHVFELPKLKCKRCEHEWVQRIIKLPKVCPNPNCKSPYWNRERQKKKIQRK